MTVDTTRSRAINALEEAVDALVEVIREANDDCDDVMAIDAVLILGTQWIDDDGDRCGGVSVLPRTGSQPYYTTLGLLDAARRQLLDSASGDL